MKKLLKDLFYIPKYKKVQEKAITVRLFFTVMTILGCLAAMSLSAYAFFNHDIVSNANTIQAASFKTKVSIHITDDNDQEVPVTTSNYKSHWANLEAGKTYTVKLEHNPQSTAKTGFVVVTAEGCEKTYHTQQLGRDGNGNTEVIIFKLKVSAATKVTFFSHWGTSSHYDQYREKGDQEELYITSSDDVIEMTVAVEQSAQVQTPATTPPAPDNTPDKPQTTVTPETTVETTAPASAPTEPPAPSVTEETTVPEETTAVTEAATEQTQSAVEGSAEET